MDNNNRVNSSNFWVRNRLKHNQGCKTQTTTKKRQQNKKPKPPQTNKKYKLRNSMVFGGKTEKSQCSANYYNAQRGRTLANDC